MFLLSLILNVNFHLFLLSSISSFSSVSVPFFSSVSSQLNFLPVSPLPPCPLWEPPAHLRLLVWSTARSNNPKTNLITADKRKIKIYCDLGSSQSVQKPTCVALPLDTEALIFCKKNCRNLWGKTAKFVTILKFAFHLEDKLTNIHFFLSFCHSSPTTVGHSMLILYAFIHLKRNGPFYIYKYWKT